MNRIELLQLIQAQWPDARMILPGGVGNVLFVDEKYHVPDESIIYKLVHWRKWYQVNVLSTYCPESNDCDEFAIENYLEVRKAFKGDGMLAFGLCNIPLHLLNFLITKQGIWLYDYRKDRLWKATNEPVYFWLI